MTTPRVLEANQVKESLRDELITLLDRVRGKKLLILDEHLSGALSLVIDFSFLKERGVERVYFLTSTKLNLDTEVNNIIYLIRSKLCELGWVANQVKEHSDRLNHVYLVPKRVQLAEKYFEERGVLGSIAWLGEFPMDFVPLEEDLFSLEYSDAFKEFYLEGDFSILSIIVERLMNLQKKYGYFPRLVGKGDYASILKDMLIRLRLELQVEQNNKDLEASSYLDSLVIIERRSDLITPLLTQLTYSGLIDEVFQIQSNLIEVPLNFEDSQQSNSNKTLSTSTQPMKQKKVMVSGKSTLYQQLCDLNFAEVGQRLNSEAKRLDDSYKSRHHATEVHQLKNFVSKLGDLQKDHQELKLNTAIAERILKYTSSEEFDQILELEQNLLSYGTNNQDINFLNQPLEFVLELIAQQKPLIIILRLISLQCQITFGLNQKTYSTYLKEITQVYGYHHIQTFKQLKRVQLIYIAKDTPSNHKFNQLASTFRLLEEEVSEHQPNDISYVYSGYAPLSIRLIYTSLPQFEESIERIGNHSTNHFNKSLIYKNGFKLTELFNTLTLGTATSLTGTSNKSLGKGWAKFEDVLKLIPGITFDTVQKKFLSANNHSLNSFNSLKEEKTLNDDIQSSYISSPLPFKKRPIILLFLGGCTRTEISAIRFLAKLHQMEGQFLILTTHIITGKKLIENLVEKGLPWLSI